MNRIAVVSVVMLLAAGSVLAYPAIGGGRGLFRVQNALVEEDAGLTISFDVIGRNPVFPNQEVGSEKGWVADLIAPELNYAPLVTRWVGAELFASWGGIFQYPQAAATDPKKFDMGLHDLKVGGKLSIPFIPVLKLGFAGSYAFPSDRETRGWLDPTAVPMTDGLGWIALATLRFQDLASSLPNVMANYSQDSVSKTYGAGVELVATGFGLFAEVQSIQPDLTTTGIFDTDNGRIRLTPGVAFGNGTSGLTFKAGYTFGFGQDAVNEALLGLVIATPFGKRAAAEFGEIAGRVTDERTGAALAADIRFPENGKLKPTKAGPGTGVFTVKRVPVGVIVVEVAAEGYQTQAFPLDIQSGGVAQQEFALRPLVTYGTIAGSVAEATSGNPLAATIAFPETNLKSVTAIAATGAFRVDNVPVGVYTVTASADGYFAGTQTVQVEEGAVAAPKFALKPLTEVSTFTGRVSDKAKDAPLAATISFPGSDVAAVKSDAGTGVFSTQIPVGSYAVQVEAEGFVPQTAAIVVEKGKPQVKNFTLVKVGMSITLRGVYFDYNKATIKSASHAALQDAANIMKESPTIKVEIQGHTDSDGSESYNQTLSQRRAQSVVTYIIQNFGIAPDRLVAMGYGESRPVADNATPEGKALNRRVEFVILEAKQK